MHLGGTKSLCPSGVRAQVMRDLGERARGAITNGDIPRRRWHVTDGDSDQALPGREGTPVSQSDSF